MNIRKIHSSFLRSTMFLATLTFFSAPLSAQIEVQPDTTVVLLSPDSVAIKDSLNATQTNRMFSPIVFYHGVAHNALSLSSNPQSKVDDVINRTLLSLYLNRPDLVSDTEGVLAKVGAPAVKGNQAAVNSINFVEEAEHGGELVKAVAEPDLAPDLGLVVQKPNFWAFPCEFSLQLMQNYVSDNWYKGGESNYAMIGSAILQANYNNKQKVKWDNKLEMKLSLQTSPGDNVHKVKPTEDLLRYTSKLGLQATKSWYYTVQLLAYTQFMRGYKANDENVYSDFLSPLNVNLSLGMEYKVSTFKNKLTGTVNLSPLSYNFRYVDRLALATRYNIDEGKHTLHDFGSSMTADVRWVICEGLTWASRLYAYTTYKRVEAEWENTFTFQFNRYIATKVFLHPRFDDGVARGEKHGYLQFKEYLSLGFNLSI